MMPSTICEMRQLELGITSLSKLITIDRERQGAFSPMDAKIAQAFAYFGSTKHHDLKE
jgi:hypothetical protein